MTGPTLGGSDSPSMQETASAPELAEAPAGGERSVDAPQKLAPGDRIGRYLLLARLGAGAMGVVFAAYDPELDRKVAVKLLRAVDDESGARRERLQREAQALAKLDHPNVVGVYDVGMHEGRLFLAMEFVAGRTLSSWIDESEGPRPWREVLEVFMAAGRGLAAAHEAGLIHRDFKPDNVMLGEDGRVRVMDFGLARAAFAEGEHPAARSRPRMNVNALVSRLTQTGAMMGTPAYMPLEQFGFGEVDARADQFSFCVSLYEALYNERPVAGKSIAELLEALQEDRPPKPPANTRVPSWVREVVVRGLAREPDQRWPSMAALLAALADDPAPRRRRWLLAGAFAVLVASGAWWVHSALQDDTQVCTHAADKLAGAWDDERRAGLKQAILATELSYAPGTSTRVEAALDAYAEQWTKARVEACEASHRGEQSSELLDLRMACLDERRQHLRATVDELTQADEAAVERAVEAVLALPSLDRCADVDALLAEVPPPEDPAVAERVAALDQQLIEVKAKTDMGRYDEALELVGAVVDEATKLAYEPLLARAWLRQGKLLDELARYADAEATLARALDAALVQGMKVEAASAAIELVQVVGLRQGRYPQLQPWITLADALARALGSDQTQAIWLALQGSLAREQGELELARRQLQRALALWASLGEADRPALAGAISHLGNVAFAEGKFADARGHYERALALQEQAFGPDHPRVADSLNNLGATAASAGEREQARAYFERALAIRERAFGRAHPKIADSLNNLGILAKMAKDYDEARDHYERALAIYEEIYGPEHSRVATALSNLGSLALVEGDYANARRYSERALAIKQAKLGSNHPELGSSFINLGDIAHREGSYADARDYHERALAIYAAIDPRHPEQAPALEGLAAVAMAESEHAEALRHYERALAIRSAGAGPPEDLARLQFSLARVLWDAPATRDRDRGRARELAERALAAFVEAGDAGAEQREQIEAWLAARAR